MTTLTVHTPAATAFRRIVRSRSIRRHALRRAVLSVGLALAIAPLPGIGRDTVRAAPVDTPVCRAHLQKIETTLSSTQARLEAVFEDGLETECAAMHDQVRAMLEVRNIYRRCISGPERINTVSAVENSIEQASERISARCTPRSADARLN
jgi:hypothetical protein